MHYFATQLHAEQQTTRSVRAAQYTRRRKHSRRDDEDDDDDQAGEEEEEDDDDDDDEDEDDESSTTRPASRVPSSFTATPEAAQLRVAGLWPGQEQEQEHKVPPFPFPHAPAKTSTRQCGSRKIQKEIAGPPSRLYAVNAPLAAVSTSRQSEPATLKSTHLSVLSAVMHRCLLERDYARAGRAWGMILRTEVSGGRPINVRNHGRWGIGAEILLHQRPTDGDLQHPNNQPLDSIYSEAGFELAREYYDRLIVQYPHRRAPRNAADEKTFHPAMFSLWIAEVCEKSKRARRTLQQEPRSRSMSIDSVMGEDDNAAITPAQEDEIQAAELAHATEIASRLDQLIASPPFDKQASLLQIRGNVALWISDLVVGKSQVDEDWDMDSVSPNSEDSSSEQLARLTNCRKELLHAQTLFQRAEANGGVRQSRTMASIDIKLRALARRIAKMQVSHEY